MATSAVPLPSPRVRAREERTKKEDERGDGAATPRYIKISGDGGRLNKRLRESSKTRRGEGKRETELSPRGMRNDQREDISGFMGLVRSATATETNHGPQ